MRALYVSVLAVAVAVAGLAQPRADATRVPRNLENILVFTPDGETLRLVATGFEEPVADVLWTRAVLLFGEHFGRSEDATWLVFFRETVEAVTTLDPGWRTAYFYGGTLLRVAGDVDGSDHVFERAVENLPADPFFPFSLGMNAYLHRQDVDAAAAWMDRAARLPGAPSWYAAAASGMKARHGDRRGAERYLEEMIEETASPAVRRDAQKKLGRLRHDDLVERWAEDCRAYYARTGERLARPEDLPSLGHPLPQNPRGDGWVVGADGVVRAEGAEQERVKKARRHEWVIAGR